MRSDGLQSASVNGSISLATISAGVSEKGIIAGVAIKGVTRVLNKDYESLLNKPSIEGVELTGNKPLISFGLNGLSMADIDDIIFGGE